MNRRLIATVAALVIAATVLTGCGRGGWRDDPTPDPATGTGIGTETVQETPATDLDAIEEDLAAVDGAVEQSAGDAGAGDAASATNDEP